MNALYTYIFKHNRYKEVIALSDEAVTKYGNAYKVWAEHQKFVSRDTFQDKEVIANHLSESLSCIMRNTSSLMKSPAT